MIFKTFDSDIDNISSKLGIFDKSFKDIVANIKTRGNNSISFLADDEVVSILDRYNKALDSGAEATAKFLNSGTGNEHMDGFLKNLDGAPATMDKYKTATKEAAIAQKSFSVATIATRAAVLALNIAVNAGLTIALSALAKVAAEVVQSEEKLKSSASELGSKLSTSTSSIEDYKNKIKELKSVLNNSSSSFSDVTQARVNLMSIQDELIEKFGTEKGVIEDVTEAIYGQTDALDELSRNAYYEAKNEFNKKTAGDKFKDWLTFGSTDDSRIQSNMDKMVAQMQSSIYSLETTGNEVLDNLIAKSYGLSIHNDTYGDGQHFLITGRLDEIKEKLYGIQELSQDFDVSTGFENNFTEISTDVDSLLNSYQDLYDQYVLYEKILTSDSNNQYDEKFNLVNQAKKIFDEATKSGDTDAIQNASDNYAQTLASAIDLAMSNYDYDVADYFKDMYPDMKRMFSEWQFNLDFEPNTNGIKDKVTSALKDLEGFSSEDILNFNSNVATDEQVSAYGELNNVAEQYGLTLQQLINLLLQMELVQSENYQQLVSQFGQDNVNKLIQEDLTYAYQIKNIGDMTFEELQAEIQKLKDEASNTPEQTSISSFYDIEKIDKEIQEIEDKIASIPTYTIASGTLVEKSAELEKQLNSEKEKLEKEKQILEDKLENSTITLDQAKIDVGGSDETTGLLNELTILQEVLADTENVSIESYEKLIGCSEDYVSALKVEGDRVEVNRKKLNTITKQRQKEKKAAIEEASALKKLQWLKHAKELKQYDYKQDELTSSIYDAIDALAQEITQFDILANAIDEAGNAFAAFKEAQNMADTGDNYDTATEMASAYEEALETGKIGTNIAKAAIEGFMDADTFKEFSKLSGKAQYDFAREYYNKNVEPYYHKGDDGEYAQDIDAFQKKATELGFSKLDEFGNWEIIADKTFGGWVENLAKAMSLNEDMVYAMLGEMEEYSFDDSFDFTSTDFVDSQYNKMKDLIDARREYNKALESGSEEDRAEAQQNLNKATEKYKDYMLNTAETVNNEYDTWNKSQGEEGIEPQSFKEYVDENVSAEDQIEMFDALNEQLDVAKDKQTELRHQLAQVPKDSNIYNRIKEQLEECNTEVETLEEATGHLGSAIDVDTLNEAELHKKVRAAQGVYESYSQNMSVLQTGMNADGTVATEEQLAAAARNVQQYADSLLSLPESVSTKIELDDSQVQAKINQVKTKIDTLKSDGTISSSEAQAYGTAIQQQKDLEAGGTKALKAMLELDTEEAMSKLEEVQAKQIDNKEVSVNVIGNALSQLDTIANKLASLNGKSATVSVNVQGGGNLPGYIPNPSDTHRPRVNGTAHAVGTAHANGTSWELPSDEDQSLVGELGTEGLVRNGKFYLIGAHGAELQNLKKGDIIFNHKQTEQLVKNGHITSRGKMLGGNAFVNGTALTTAHNDVTGGIYISPDNRKDKPNSNGKGDGDSADDTADDLKEATKEVFDWIERRIAKLQRLTDKWIKNAETALTSGFITKYFNKAKKTLDKELKVQEQAFHRYQAEADKSGLPKEWKKKVNDGLVDIETITDDGLAEQINDYQNWRDKSIACLEAFATAAEKRFNIPLEKAKAKIENFNETLDLLGKKLDNARFGTKKQLDSANALVQQQTDEENNILDAYKKAKKDSKSNLKKQSKAMKSSAVLKGDDVSKSEKKKIKEAVKNGKEINLSFFKEGSKAYQQAVKYNEALKANKQATYDLAVAQEEYNAWLVEASKIKFDNTAKYYENQIKILEHQMASYDRSIKEAEATANKINRQYYEAQKGIVAKELADYQAELIDLEAKLKDIKPGTDEWYDAKDALEEVKQSISDCVVQTAELNNAINKLYFDAHHNLKSDIDRIIAEQNLLTELFSHEANASSDIGNLTDAGIANLGSKTAIYELTKSKAEETGQIVKELQYMFDNNLKSYGDYEFNSITELENKLKEFYTEWQEDIAETYQAQAAIVDLMKEKYQAELEMVQQLINDKKEALAAEKDLYSYQKSIKEKTTNINTLQRQLAAYSGDTSEEGMAKRQQVATKLNEATEDLKETEYEKYLSDQESMLDNLSTEYEELITKKLEDFQGLFQEGVGLANENISTTNSYLSSVVTDAGYTQETKDLFNGVSGSIAANCNNIIAKLDLIHQVLNAGLANSQASGSNANNGGDSNNSGSNNVEPDYSKYTNRLAENREDASNIQNQLSIVKEKLMQKNLSKKEKASLTNQQNDLTAQLIHKNNDLAEIQLALAEKYIDAHLSKAKKDKSEYSDLNQKLYKTYNGQILSSAELQELASLLGVVYDGAGKSKNLYKLLKQIKFPGFSKGGTVVSVGAINKRIKDNGDDALASVKVGESILTPVDSKNLANMVGMFRDINLNSDMIHQLNRLPDALNNVSNLQKTNAINYGGVEFNFEISNVSNADEIVSAIQNSKKVQKALQSVTVDRINGGGRLNVRSVK